MVTSTNLPRGCCDVQLVDRTDIPINVFCLLFIYFGPLYDYIDRRPHETGSEVKVTPPAELMGTLMVLFCLNSRGRSHTATFVLIVCLFNCYTDAVVTAVLSVQANVCLQGRPITAPPLVLSASPNQPRDTAATPENL